MSTFGGHHGDMVRAELLAPAHFSVRPDFLFGGIEASARIEL